jgi:hypothetical protein
MHPIPECLRLVGQYRQAATNRGLTNLRRHIFGSDLLMMFGTGKRSISMATQIVMDHTGDTRHYFDADDTETLLKAEERFKALTSAGFTAAVRDAAGDVTVTRSFDPGAEETLFYPRLVGG